MNDNEGAAATVIAVLLTDGWHQIVPGSFSVGPLGLGGGADLGLPGFRFAEADAGRPYRPTVLAGPLDSIIAVRQVSPAVRRIGDQDRVRAVHNGQRADQGARLRVHADRWAARG
ncbi:MAG TPA: hypothetical protein VED20_16465 [Streptosporangiaceae bacterium]|nr:hypothetical protein [Streptosporangiaceae bacterium]